MADLSYPGYVYKPKTGFQKMGFRKSLTNWSEPITLCSFSCRIRIWSPNRPKTDPGPDFDIFCKIRLLSATALARMACKGVLNHFVLSHLVTLVIFFDFWSFRGSRISRSPSPSTRAHPRPAPHPPKTASRTTFLFIIFLMRFYIVFWSIWGPNLDPQTSQIH